MILRNGKRLISCDEDHNKKKKKTNSVAKFTKMDDDDDDDDSCPYLPEELFLENILIRLTSRDLAICSCVSKLWYNSILKDPRFASCHFLQNKNRLNLVFNLLNVAFPKRDWAYFLRLEEEEAEKKDPGDNFVLNYSRLISSLSYSGTNELVGYCNGLACTKEVISASDNEGVISVVNPNRGETLDVTFLTPTSTAGELCMYLCSGFGFDSLTLEYKVVLIYTTTTSTSTISGDQEFVCLVLTLGGTYSWRKIVISTPQISPPLGTSSPFPSPMVMKSSGVTAATLCGGDLVWQITNTTPSDSNKIDMLLSFDIHNENIHFICLPTECSPTPTTTTRDEDQCLEVEHHLLEFKGYLCVARSEKIMTRSNSRHHHHHHGRSWCYRRHHCNGQRRKFCCCGFKVHLFILKDKVNQVWIKGEIFDVQIKEEGLLPAPFCCYFDATITTTSPHTRMLSFSDQLFLYWSDGEYLLLYNLHLKHLKVVKCSSSCNKRIRRIFEAKRQGIRRGRCIGYYDNFFFPFMDYQLHAQAENILSLKNFIPEGETSTFNTLDDFEQFIESGGKIPAGVVTTWRESVKMHPFYC